MKFSYLCITLIALTSGCASQAAKAPACAGARRSANPYGSVLVSGASPAAAPTQAPSSGSPPCLGPAR